MPCAHCPSSDVAYWLSGLSTLVNKEDPVQIVPENEVKNKSHSSTCVALHSVLSHEGWTSAALIEQVKGVELALSATTGSLALPRIRFLLTSNPVLLQSALRFFPTQRDLDELYDTESE